MPSVAKARIRLYGVLLVCNLINFSLSAAVNNFHDFFYVADLLPFCLSIITFLLVGATLLGDLKGSNPVLSRPMLELFWLGALTVFWLCFNAFSSSRWRFVQASDCSAIPSGDDYASVSAWCKEVQALRSFVWIEWIIVAGAFIWLWMYVRRESSRGNKHIWATSFARPARTMVDLAYGNRHRSLGAFSTGAASSFHTGENESRYSTQSQPYQNDFEKASEEHRQNINHPEHVPSHSYNQSGSSGYSQYARQVQQQQTSYQQYQYPQPPPPQRYLQQPQQSYGYVQQGSSGYQHHKSPSAQSQEAYFFGGYGQAQ